MSRKPENSFILSVHKYLPTKEELHREKNSNPYTSGTPDCFYSGKRADLWVEYKFIPRVPAKAMILPDLSELQKDWLNDYYERTKGDNSRHAAVIVGCPDGGVVFTNKEWMTPITPDEFRERLSPRKELALWIALRTTKRAAA